MAWFQKPTKPYCSLETWNHQFPALITMLHSPPERTQRGGDAMTYRERRMLVRALRKRGIEPKEERLIQLDIDLYRFAELLWDFYCGPMQKIKLQSKLIRVLHTLVQQKQS